MPDSQTDPSIHTGNVPLLQSPKASATQRMAGLLTYLISRMPSQYFLGTMPDFPVALYPDFREIQQRDCPGLSPGSLLIVCRKFDKTNHYVGKYSTIAWKVLNIYVKNNYT